jgi:hypothetical protein
VSVRMIQLENRFGYNVNLGSVDFFSWSWGGSDPSLDAAFLLAYFAFPRWYEFGERRWNDTDRGNRRTRRKTCPSATLPTTNPTWIDPGANPGLRGERPATNDLSHGMANGSVDTFVTVITFIAVVTILTPLPDFPLFWF